MNIPPNIAFREPCVFEAPHNPFFEVEVESNLDEEAGENTWVIAGDNPPEMPEVGFRAWIYEHGNEDPLENVSHVNFEWGQASVVERLKVGGILNVLWLIYRDYFSWDGGVDCHFSAPVIS